MRNPNGPSREDLDEWMETQRDAEELRFVVDTKGGGWITCPECGERVANNKTRDELTLDQYAECNCGWWRKVVTPRK